MKIQYHSKNILQTVILCSALLLLLGCDDMLDKEPKNNVSASVYLRSENDLSAYSANLYGVFPVHAGYGIGVFGVDNNSDNQAGTNPNGNFIPQQVRVPQSGGEWEFANIRTCNYFLNRVNSLLQEDAISGNKDNIDHYLGEMYFFRAYIYFNKLRALGDFPIITTMVGEDYETVRKHSERRPRNEVARFIISDLDSAYLLMKDTPPMSNRLTKKAAALLKSRVALYEGTWEKYHKGTARVPGGPGWPGSQKDYLRDFTINIDDEVAYFLEEAKKAAELVADNTPLAENYAAMFNSITLNDPEVILWKKYDNTITPAVYHFTVGYLQRNGGGNSGYTRSMVESFLMENGYPIYADGSGYLGDATLENVAANRDHRLVQSLILPGDKLTDNNTTGLIENSGYYYRPPITDIAENRCPTGYSIKKGLTTDPNQGPTQQSITASVVFRAAEAYLNYIEADYLLNGTLDAKSDKYWKALRTRAGVDPDYMKTIAATDLSKEPDLAKYSGTALVDKTLYNIRRERRNEFIAEGMRKDDLYRWRSLDMMKDYIVEGFDLWTENYKLYSEPKAGIAVISLVEEGAGDANVSAQSDSKYIRPYRINKSNLAFGGYNFVEANYLSPIAFDHFRLTTEVEGSGDVNTSSIYQNPGWKIEVGAYGE